MKNTLCAVILQILIASGGLLGGSGLLAAAPAPTPQTIAAGSRPIWVCAYYLAGDQDRGPLTPDKVDFTAFSHLIHFGIFPGADATIDPIKGGITPAQSQAVVSRAHAAGCKALVCLGSDPGTKNLRHALTDPCRASFVRNLVQFVVSRGYDGLDIDMEPLEDKDIPNYEQFIVALRAQMNAINPQLLLTAAVASEPAMFARLQSQFDQINLMTYDLSGTWPGFKTWYNASLYDGGAQRMNPDEPFPSVDGMVQQFVNAGVPPAKLGIGIAFYGYLWSGASGPQQSIQGVTVNDDIAYYTVMDKYYTPERYHWDNQAQAPYLSIDAPLPKERKFLSYDDARLCAKKIDYARSQGLGGVIIWQLGEGYRESQPDGQKDALLQSVKQAWRAAPQ